MYRGFLKEEARRPQSNVVSGKTYTSAAEACGDL